MENRIWVIMEAWVVVMIDLDLYGNGSWDLSDNAMGSVWQWELGSE